MKERRVFMQVYDTVNKLAEELKQSEEYKNLKEAKKIISDNNEYQKKILELNKRLEASNLRLNQDYLASGMDN